MTLRRLGRQMAVQIQETAIDKAKMQYVQAKRSAEAQNFYRADQAASLRQEVAQSKFAAYATATFNFNFLTQTN